MRKLACFHNNEDDYEYDYGYDVDEFGNNDEYDYVSQIVIIYNNLYCVKYHIMWILDRNY